MAEEVLRLHDICQRQLPTPHMAISVISSKLHYSLVMNCTNSGICADRNGSQPIVTVVHVALLARYVKSSNVLPHVI
jgi:hypothetical protein